MLRNVRTGHDVTIRDFVNLYDTIIGHKTKIGPFVEIGGATIGHNCNICSHTYICPGTSIEDNVFIGHHVSFTNDKYPRATNADGEPKTSKDWKQLPTLVKKGASIGSGVTILPGITIGENAIVGAGCVISKDVPDNTIVAGNPAIVIGDSTDVD